MNFGGSTKCKQVFWKPQRSLIKRMLESSEGLLRGKEIWADREAEGQARGQTEAQLSPSSQAPLVPGVPVHSEM